MKVDRPLCLNCAKRIAASRGWCGACLTKLRRLKNSGKLVEAAAMEQTLLPKKPKHLPPSWRPRKGKA